MVNKRYLFSPDLVYLIGKENRKNIEVLQVILVVDYYGVTGYHVFKKGIQIRLIFVLNSIF